MNFLANGPEIATSLEQGIIKLQVKTQHKSSHEFIPKMDC